MQEVDRGSSHLDGSNVRGAKSRSPWWSAHIGVDRSEAVKRYAERIYIVLLAEGVNVLLDYRSEHSGAMCVGVGQGIALIIKRVWRM